MQLRNLNDVDFLHTLTMNKNVDLAGRMIYNDKGAVVLDVLKKEPSFYDWILKGDFPLDTSCRLTEIQLRMFVNGKR